MDSIRRCSVDECDHSDIQARGLCRKHYFRWYRTGTTEVGRPQRASRGVCTIEGCEQTDAGASRLCKMHETRLRRHGDPLAVQTPKVHRGADNNLWAGDRVTYGGMHIRVRRTRGRASEYECVDCGKRARQWSYDHRDPAERQATEGPYSLSVDHYEARCIPCHKRFDLGAHRDSA